jgi:TolB protein
MLWMMRPDGTAPRQITFVRNGADAIDSFAWSPDGSQIAATRFNLTDSQISIIDLGPPATSRQVTAEAGGAYDPAWSPDGHYLAYMARNGTRSVISVLDLQTGTTTPLFETDMARSPQWSPNGTSLAYLALSGKNFEIFTLDLRWDASGAVQPGRTTQLTSDFGADGVSGLSWVG